MSDLFCTFTNTRGMKRVDDRRVLSYVLKSGGRWGDAPIKRRPFSGADIFWRGREGALNRAMIDSYCEH